MPAGTLRGMDGGRGGVDLWDRSLTLWSFAFALTTFWGCSSSSPDDRDLSVALALDPSPPEVGEANVSLTLSTAGGQPIEGATVRLEGNMNHAGMKPTFADLNESDPGNYTGTLRFTMGGDWFIVVTASTPDGRRLEKTIDVRGVRPK
jgi:hypothetical protein